MVVSLVKFLRATIGTWHQRIQCPTVLSPLVHATQGKHGQVSTAAFWLCTLAGSLGAGSSTAFVVNAVICLGKYSSHKLPLDNHQVDMLDLCWNRRHSICFCSFLAGLANRRQLH